jgi:hypothetical protein
MECAVEPVGLRLLALASFGRRRDANPIRNNTEAVFAITWRMSAAWQSWYVSLQGTRYWLYGIHLLPFWPDDRR